MNLDDDQPKKPPDLKSNEDNKENPIPNFVSSQNEQIQQISNLNSNENEQNETLSNFSSKEKLSDFVLENNNDEKSKNSNNNNNFNQIKNDNDDDNENKQNYNKKTDQTNNNNDNDHDIDPKESQILLKNAEKEEIIGQGNYAEVYKVKINGSNDGAVYSAKVFFVCYPDYPRSSRKEISEHMSIILQLNFPSVLRSYDYSTTGFGKEHRQTVLTDYCPNGSLEKAIKNKDFNETKKVINIFGIAAAMNYIHKNNIMHYDLKTSTILEDEHFYPKLSDIGYSKHFQGLKAMAKIKEFSPYIAPEVLMDDQFTFKSEVYSFALIVYEIVTDKKPFENLSQFDLLTKLCEGGRPDIPKEISIAYTELIRNCWDSNPDKRPTFEDICRDLRNNNEFMRKLEDAEEYKKYIDMLDNFASTNNSFNQNIKAEIIEIPEDEKKPKKVKKKKKSITKAKSKT